MQHAESRLIVIAGNLPDENVLSDVVRRRLECRFERGVHCSHLNEILDTITTLKNVSPVSAFFVSNV